MKSLTTFLLTITLMVGTAYTFAQSNPIVKADSIEVVEPQLSGFNSIKIAGPFTVHIIQGATESVKLEVPVDVKGRITAKVTGGILKIHNAHDNWSQGYKSWYSDKSVWRHHKKIVVYITVKDLKRLNISGSGDATFDEGIAANSLKLTVRGSGHMLGKIEVKTLESHVSGSGSIKLSGRAENSAVKVTGSGHFIARDLITLNSAVHVSGSGKAEVNASEKVNAAVYGSGDVHYSGTVKAVKKTKSGSGEISSF
ncbi:MAG TPA: head GIN domain-containing protein [Mucilaginibacter sp.]|jgi:hypothetical protein